MLGLEPDGMKSTADAKVYTRVESVGTTGFYRW
jgi:hypothetical protein